MPERYWWLKRIALGVGVYLLLMVGLRLVWGPAAIAGFERGVDRVRAAGYAVRREDGPPALTYEQQRAAQAWTALGQRVRQMEWPADYRAGGMRRWLRQREPAIAAADGLAGARAPQRPAIRGGGRGRGRGLGQQAAADLSVADERALIAGNLLELEAQLAATLELGAAPVLVDWAQPSTSLDPGTLNVGRVMIDAGVLALHEGRLADAAARWGDVLDVARAATRLDMQSSGTRRHNALLRNLRLSVQYLRRDAGAHRESLGPLLGEVVPGLIAELLDESDVIFAARGQLRIGRYTQVWARERIMREGTGRYYRSFFARPPAALRRTSDSVWLWTEWLLDRALSPVTLTEKLRMVEICAEADRWVGIEPWTIHEVRGLQERAPVGWLSKSVMDRYLSPNGPYDPNYTATDDVADGQVLRRSLAVGFALQWYAAEHGCFPEALEMLVPAYLPYVPRDPHDWDGRALRYFVADDHTAAIYSVGQNREDDGGPAASRWPGVQGDIVAEVEWN